MPVDHDRGPGATGGGAAIQRGLLPGMGDVGRCLLVYLLFHPGLALCPVPGPTARRWQAPLIGMGATWRMGRLRGIALEEKALTTGKCKILCPSSGFLRVIYGLNKVSNMSRPPVNNREPGPGISETKNSRDSWSGL
ncbi:protein of unknown function [Denitratisoma oestradiolicum]|uniref:Uncharacterized protein n=1 Tax=Denitratisoma oestradiolicum TaxID=311182 RepID=A0A6S6XWU4_9PROT|nr:protein of unknown function [Denitratisoma oestradiolicum]